MLFRGALRTRYWLALSGSSYPCTEARKRIAAGSGVTVTEVNTMLNKFYEMQKMMKNMGKLQKMMAKMGGGSMSKMMGQ